MFPLEDRGWGDMFVTMQEVSNGLLAPMAYYALIEQARAFGARRSPAEHRVIMAGLLASLSAVAAANPCAQFPLALTADVQWMKDSYRDQADIEGLIVGARAVYEF